MRQHITGRGIDRNRVTLLVYGLLLLAIAVPAWIALGGVLILFFGDDEEFGRNVLLLVIWGIPLLVIALAASAALVAALRRRSTSYRALLA